MLEDKLLILKLRRGDGDAVRELYEKYKDKLRTIAGSILGDSHGAEDVLHDVFVVFAENARGFQIRTSLRNYLITCVANRARDEFRRRKLKTVGLDKAAPIASNTGSPESRIIADEKVRRLTDALAAIPYEQREAVVLHLNGGLKFREVAQVQQTSVSTVHGRYKYGLKKLRAILGEELEK